MNAAETLHIAIGTLEREAANLWAAENPNMSAFNCDAQMREHYLRRVADAWVAQLLGPKPTAQAVDAGRVG